MQSRLLRIVRERVGNGEITESHLARLMGISQSHIHNVLKGARKLSLELGDEILDQLRLDTSDLLENSARYHAMPFRSVPFLSGALGFGMELFEPNHTAGTTQVPAHIAASLFRPIAARLGLDPKAAPRFESGDLILIDQALPARRKTTREGVYVVTTSDGPRLRYVRQTLHSLYLVSEESILFPARWESVPMPTNLLSTVRGRVVWISRQFETALEA